MAALSVQINSIRTVEPDQLEQRAAERHPCQLEGVSRPLETVNSLSWGAKILDLSSTGIGLSLCYPFRPGSYLVIDVQGTTGAQHFLLARVVHVNDQNNGTWHVGCEFVKKLGDNEMDLLI